MSQTNLTVENAPGAQVRANLNTHFAALASQNSGGTTPPAIFPNMMWYDDSLGVLKQRNNANTAWVELWRVGGVSGKQFILSKGADVPSAPTIVVNADGNYFDVTGSATITSISAISPGMSIRLHFDSTPTLTHNINSLTLPGGTNINVGAGDEAEFIEYELGKWRCVSYLRASVAV